MCVTTVMSREWTDPSGVGVVAFAAPLRIRNALQNSVFFFLLEFKMMKKG